MPGISATPPATAATKNIIQSVRGAWMGGKKVMAYATKRATTKQIIDPVSHFFISSRITRGVAITIRLKKKDPMGIG